MKKDCLESMNAGDVVVVCVGQDPQRRYIDVVSSVRKSSILVGNYTYRRDTGECDGAPEWMLDLPTAQEEEHFLMRAVYEAILEEAAEPQTLDRLRRALAVLKGEE